MRIAYNYMRYAWIECSRRDIVQDWQAVHEWHRVVNERDLDAARHIVTDDVSIGGPKGQASGRDVFIDWIAHAGIRLVPVSWHPVTDTTIVVVQDATWPGRTDSDPAAAPIRLATLFRLEDGRIAAALRFDSLRQALTATGCFSSEA
jgi:hypothetical protein